MSQYGSVTVIAPRTRLILMDCFETIVAMQDGRYVVRQGIIEFLNHFSSRRSIPVAVITDAGSDAVEAALAEAGVRNRFQAVFHRADAVEDLPDGRCRKRLDVPLAAFAVAADQAVFIGDSPMDAEAAQHYAVPFIRVPRSEDRSFTFVSLISGPSRYDSAEFSARMIDEYLKRKRE